MGLTMTQWDELPEYDRAWALGLDYVDAEEKIGQCSQCGGPADVCQDADNEHAYKVTWRRCYRTRAIKEAERARTDHDGVIAVVTLDPSRKKSAGKKGAGDG